MTGAPNPADRAGDGTLMSEHGITCTLVPHYVVDGYRYTSLADALAHAKRRSARSGGVA
jgi:hypothetical protein